MAPNPKRRRSGDYGKHDWSLPEIIGEKGSPAINLFRRNTKAQVHSLTDLAQCKRLSAALGRDDKPMSEEQWDRLRKQLEFLHILLRLQALQRSMLILRMTTLHESDRKRAEREIDDVQRRIDTESESLACCDDFLRDRALANLDNDDEIREILHAALRDLNERAQE